MIEILFLVIFLLIVFTFTNRENYNAVTTSADLNPQLIGFSYDIDTTALASIIIDGGSGTYNLSPGDLNRYSWTHGYYGFRKTLKPGGGGKVYFFTTRKIVPSDFQKVSSTIGSALGVPIPSNILYLNSVANPSLDVNCAYSRTTACTAGYNVDTYIISTPAKADGTCTTPSGMTIPSTAISPATAFNYTSSIICSCPAGKGFIPYTTTTPGSCNSCTAGYYSTGGTNSCVKTPAGTYISGTNATSPGPPCSAGTYSPTGASTCSACTNAAAAGFYYSTTGATNSPCPTAPCTNSLAIGSYYSGNGGINSNGCPTSPCSIPANSDATSSGGSSLTGCTWACRAGYYNNSGTCSPCPLGTYSAAGASICSNTPAGTYISVYGGTVANEQTCTNAAVGFYYNTIGATNSTCPTAPCTNPVGEGLAYSTNGGSNPTGCGVGNAAGSKTWSYSGTIDSSWSVPGVSGSNRICTFTVTGATGGKGKIGDGGKAAIVVATFTIAVGTVVNVVVGGKGLGNTSGAGSGGGGSFVFIGSINLTNYIAAGGGGGSGGDTAGGCCGNGQNANTTSSGTGDSGVVTLNTNGNGATSVGTGGLSSYATAPPIYKGGDGGGIGSLTSSNYNFTGGGSSGTYGCTGGFGGGGGSTGFVLGTSNYYAAGGGGGGYSGGTGGNVNNTGTVKPGGGGGGSNSNKTFTATLTSYTTDASNNGFNGSVSVSYT
jgi:hypothetical protein